MAFKERFQAFLNRSRMVLLGTVAALVVIWVLFFDSHSILTRIQLMAERSELQADNEVRKARVAELEAKLGRPLTDWDIEELAREEYGMSREGETVYPVVEE
ncbi:MAG: septum formation initiator family protein [Bacteroidetes bacterium]|nr:septum formation initiator family protein [Bacteroidota bacterium]MDA0873806.1 septum formation initiator family protein [Bacteroidota bacterium]